LSHTSVKRASTLGGKVSGYETVAAAAAAAAAVVVVGRIDGD
jgi:hypothetical protein